ncbi:MAG: [FeFe] hydrogenase H-cluster radical SAM maturase HydE [Rikenellaceae bacterium]
MRLNIESKDDIISILDSDSRALLHDLFADSTEVKLHNVGALTYYRGLIELSNKCAKDCYYCGIRKSNDKIIRYDLDDKDVVEAAQCAYRLGLGSVALQAGEIVSEKQTLRITHIIEKIKALSGGQLGITLSLGEQSIETYRQWKDAGAERYLLRIETSSRELYSKLHPLDHSYDQRLEALMALRDLKYQVGSGVMVGLPYQTTEQLADDLLFLKNIDIDMCGMGPYIEHVDTPLYQKSLETTMLSLEERFMTTLKMIALLRILMPTINIAAATSLETIDRFGREKAIKVGANVVMPNITPAFFKKNYSLYNNKPFGDQSNEEYISVLTKRIERSGDKVVFFKKGNSLHFKP